MGAKVVRVHYYLDGWRDHCGDLVDSEHRKGGASCGTLLGYYLVSMWGRSSCRYIFWTTNFSENWFKDVKEGLWFRFHRSGVSRLYRKHNFHLTENWVYIVIASECVIDLGSGLVRAMKVDLISRPPFCEGCEVIYIRGTRLIFSWLFFQAFTYTIGAKLWNARFWAS